MEGHLLLEVGLVGVELFGGVDFCFTESIYDLLDHPARLVDPADVGEQQVEVVGQDVAIGDPDGLDMFFLGSGMGDVL